MIKKALLALGFLLSTAPCIAATTKFNPFTGKIDYLGTGSGGGGSSLAVWNGTGWTSVSSVTLSGTGLEFAIRSGTWVIIVNLSTANTRLNNLDISTAIIQSQLFNIVSTNVIGGIPGDNFGTHIASQDVDMANFAVKQASGIYLSTTVPVGFSPVIQSSRNFILTSTGNVGIGTIFPVFPLHVRPPSAGPDYIALFDGSNLGQGLVAIKQPGGTAPAGWRIVTGLGNTNIADFVYQVGIGVPNRAYLGIAGTEVLTINTDSKVGINTTGPRATLHAAEPDGDAGPLLAASTGTTKLFEVTGTSITLAIPPFLTGFDASCTAIETDANGQLVCGSDGGGSGGADNLGTHIASQPVDGGNFAGFNFSSFSVTGRINSPEVNQLNTSTGILFSQHNAIVSTNSTHFTALANSTNALATAISTNAAILRSNLNVIVATNVLPTTDLTIGSMTVKGTITSTSSIISLGNSSKFNQVSVTTLAALGTITSTTGFVGGGSTVAAITITGLSGVNCSGKLITDAAGNVYCGTDQTAAGGGDQMGSHMSTRPINGNFYPIDNVSSITIVGAGSGVIGSTWPTFQFQLTDGTDQDLEINESSITTVSTVFTGSITARGAITTTNTVSIGGDLQAWTTDFFSMGRLVQTAFSSMTYVTSFSTMSSFGRPMFQKEDSTRTFAVYWFNGPGNGDVNLDPIIPYASAQSTGTQPDPMYLVVAVATDTSNGTEEGNVVWKSTAMIVLSSPTAGIIHRLKKNPNPTSMTNWKTVLADSKTFLVKVWFWGVNGSSQRWPEDVPIIWRRRH